MCFFLPLRGCIHMSTPLFTTLFLPQNEFYHSNLDFSVLYFKMILILAKCDFFAAFPRIALYFEESEQPFKVIKQC